RDGVNRDWLHQALRFKKRLLESFATQNAQKNINLEILKPLPFDVPPISEQNRIAEILLCWDDAIDKTEKLIRLTQDRLRGIRLELFGETSLKKSSWVTTPLATIAERVRRKSDGGDHPIMTISGRSGFLRQDEKFNRFMAGASVQNYTLLKRGEFAY